MGCSGCASLREVFGESAPRVCAVCELRERKLDLAERGFVEVPQAHLLAYKDCGVPIETTRDHRVYVPAWAERIVQLCYGTWSLNPILTRAAVDQSFAEAVMTILDLEEEVLALGSLLGFAREMGLEFGPPSPRESKT